MWGRARIAWVAPLLALAACTSAMPSHHAAPDGQPSVTLPVISSSRSFPVSPPTSSHRAGHRPSPPPTSSTSSITTSTAVPPPTTSSSSSAPRHHHPSAGAPVIVLDPGHSVAISATDPRNGLDVSDYENEPEMTDVWHVALLVRTQLEADGYRVVLTKKSLDAPTSLLDRAQVADRVHADLAVSIHDQAGSDGGIGFAAGNNIVYFQSVGDYRVSDSGQRVTFTDKHVAAVSRAYGQIFQKQRSKVEGQDVVLQGNTGYDLGGRGLAGGNMWMVQLLSHVPWIYNESGGNSAGRSGLDRADRRTYADGLVASIEHCVPPPPGN